MPLVIGGIEASLRRIAHYDYWSRQGPPLGARRHARRPARLRQRRARDRRDRAPPRGRRRTEQITRPARHRVHRRRARRLRPRSTRRRIDAPGPRRSEAAIRTRWRRSAQAAACATGERRAAPRLDPARAAARPIATRRSIRMPSFEQVSADPVLYAHASRILHLEANPGNARALVQRHGNARRLDQPAAAAADDAGDGRALRAAVHAPAASAATARRRCPRTR